MITTYFSRSRWETSLLNVAALLALSFGLQGTAATFTVTSLADNGPGSLRQAIADAGPGDMIDFTVSGKIALGSELVVSQELAIAGPGNSLTLDAGFNGRHFRIESGEVKISGLQLVGGWVGSVAPLEFDDGGAIVNSGVLTISQCVISNNFAVGSGGGIYNSPSGRLVLRDSVVVNCLAISGGGLKITAGGQAAIENCLITGNSTDADGNGGGIENEGDVILTSTRVVSNTSTHGGGGGIANYGRVAVIGGEISGNGAINDVGAGVYNSGGGTLDLNGCTIADNVARTGGGLENGGDCTAIECLFSGNGCFEWEGGLACYNRGSFSATNCTISGNINFLGSVAVSTSYGGQSTFVSCTITGNRGGLKNVAEVPGTVSIRNSIVWGNDYGDLFGPITSLDYNLIPAAAAAALAGATNHNLVGLEPYLLPLADNGGPTRTQALEPWSPAVDTGVSDGIATDQRGLARPKDSGEIANAEGGDGADIGAVEVQDPHFEPIHVVRVLADSGPGSLRQAIADAPPGGRIEFAVTGTITLLTGELTVERDLNIEGPGSGLLTVSAASRSRVFRIAKGATTLTGLTVADGAGPLGGFGGGLLNEDRLTLVRCVIWSNSIPEYFSATSYGGGVYSYGSLLLTECLVADNTAGSGGGIANSGTLQVERSTFARNQALSVNWGGLGGALFNAGNAALRVTTLSATSAGSSVIYNGYDNRLNAARELTLENTTITGNAPIGIANTHWLYGAGGTVRLRNTLVAANGSGDLAGVFMSDGFNLIGITDGSSGLSDGANGDRVGTAAAPLDPLLGPLRYNGGLTPTHALLPGSPAIDRGSSGGLNTDQRGLPRPVDLVSIANVDGGDGSDIGAFELTSLDSDGDGLPDDYEQLHNLNWNDPADATLDADQDGQSNLAEYLAGTDPQSPASVFRLMNVHSSGADLSVSFTSVAGKSYRLEAADTLAPQTWNTIADGVAGTGSPIEVVDIGVSVKSARFYRVSVR
ncbi:MAG: hypothetical protein KJ072_05245 [Verrucomicrobia bacterium]|nr:hypothetical protein [Verrucomicrobiota bacterium]